MDVHIAGRVRHSSVDGPGVRYVLFFQGCIHHCPFCQNPETWDPSAGIRSDTAQIIAEILETRYLDGVTLSGGDPLLQAGAALEITQAAEQKGLPVWIYTGWTYEELLAGQAGETAIKVLGAATALVDGRFIMDLKDESLPYRGSSNQRIIDLKQTRAAGHVIEIKR